MLNSVEDGNFKDSKAIIACPSVGNVSQLAMDLLISSLKVRHIGSLWHPAVLPFVGADPYDTKSQKLCTSCDIYFCPDKKLLLVQLRAPVLTDNQTDFLNELSEWLKNLYISEVVVLAGIFSVGHYEENVKYGSYRFVCCPLSQKLNGEHFESLQWTRMKKNNEENDFTCPSLSGSGFARRLLNICVKNVIPCTVLLYFCLEGDNVNDSVCFLKKVDEWLRFFENAEKDIIVPPSWNYLFGNSSPDMMY